MPFLSFRTKQSFDRRTSGGRLCRKDRSKEHCSRSELSELLFAKSFLKGFVTDMAAPKLEMWLRWGFHGRATLGPACTFAFKQSQLWAQCGRQGISDRHRQTPNHLNQIWKGSRTKQTENKEVQSRKWQEGAVSKKKRDEQGWTPFTHKRSQECCVLTRERTPPTCKNQQGLQMAKRVRKWRKDANSKDRLSERAGWSHSLDSSVWKNIHWNLVDQWWPVMTSGVEDLYCAGWRCTEAAWGP